MVLKYAQLLAIFLVGVNASCDSNILTKIKDLWNGSPPTGLIDWSMGTAEYVYLSKAYFDDDYKNISCFTTTVDPDQVSATDFVIFNDNLTADFVTYNLTEEEPGVLLTSGEDIQEDLHVYVVYKSTNVLAFYQCSKTDNDTSVYSAIEVKGYNPADKSQADEIDEAKKILVELEIGDDLVPIDTSGCLEID